MPLPITSATAAAVALLLLILAIQTVRQRLRTKQAFGDGDNPALVSAIRSHGNLAEHAPIVLIMLGLLENAGANPTILTCVAAVFVAGRISHAIGLHQPSEPGRAPLARQIGVVITWLAMFGLAGHILFKVFA